MSNRLHIILHALPREIDGVERILDHLHRGAAFLQEEDKVILDCSLNLSSELTYWDTSSIPKEYFIEKWKVIERKADWTYKNYFDIVEDNSVLGCNDKRRNSIRKYADETDYFMYLDCDVFFSQYSLLYFFRTFEQIENDYAVITPELLKLWDQSWDMISSKRWSHYSYDSKIWTTYDHFKLDRECFDYLDSINIRTVPIVKFGGGLLTAISSNLLKLIDIPDTFPGYGLDDTFVMACANHMKQVGKDVQQYVLENIIVMENRRYKGADFNTYLNLLDDPTSDERGQVIKNKFRSIAEQNFSKELQLFKARI